MEIQLKPLDVALVLLVALHDGFLISLRQHRLPIIILGGLAPEEHLLGQQAALITGVAQLGDIQPGALQNAMNLKGGRQPSGAFCVAGTPSLYNRQAFRHLWRVTTWIPSSCL